MHDRQHEIHRRLDRMLDERIRPAVVTARSPLTVRRWDVDGEPVPVGTALTAVYRDAEVGEPWGPAWSTTWFALTGRVPDDWDGIVESHVDLGFGTHHPGFSAEGLAYRPDGSSVKGLHPRNQWLPVEGPEVTYLVEAAANPDISMRVPTLVGDVRTASREPMYRLVAADLVLVDQQIRELAADLDVLGQLAAVLPADDARGPRLWQTISQALDRIDLADIPGTAASARAVLAPALAATADPDAHRITAVGHAHIDSAWLWPLRETVRKVARTCSNVVQLMDDRPELVFAMSQAQQLAWLKEHRPEVFERVREKIAGGRFVPVGGMWVESDTNMPGGEAMARQFLHGKTFFEREFGIDTQEVWLPDSFGYSAALPQLIALSGSRWFLTQKISWNTVNKFPHHTFWWEGIDGTRVFTHFPPVDTYNSELSAAELRHSAVNFADRARATHALAPMGWGDGGGGPTREMLDRAARLADLAGSPRVSIRTPAEFFADAQAEYPDAPVWWGELYLEIHRGTYTSQAKIKQGNRRNEHLLREAELWCTTATVRAGAEYPAARLDRLWKTLLLNQFHDILPGSSIAWVNRQARDDHAAVTAELEQIIAGALQVLGCGGTPGAAVANAAPHARRGIPAGGAAVPAEATPVSCEQDGGTWLLDNGLVRVVVDGEGHLASVVDAPTGREAIAPGSVGGLLQIHPDLPNDWDAWDIDEFYRDTVRDIRDVTTIRPVDGGVEVLRSYGASTFTVTISLTPGSPTVDLAVDADWQEQEKLLKLAFPLDVRAAESAAETQFGHVLRPTHTNTTWDAAKFEICAHRFLHVGEPGYGAAVVNDSTYGHDVTRDVRPDGGTTTTVRLSLLRAPRWPDPETDLGRHRLRCAVVPGATVLDAVREGYRINLPEREVAAPVAPLLAVDNDAVVVESVKMAEDGSGDLVARLFAAGGGREKAVVTVDVPVTGVRYTDLLERPLTDAPAPVDPHRVELDLRPFRIVTLRWSRG
ncbi:alpha-mannosidase [Nakamurella sp. YIM 132087]|uniref:Alpha-mannosidase n=1 Tax=Nakamurella alba TaxID=2665158 RepID=A0A7K1FSR4_9ACTN|nr:glycoside hydrolase family 38 C-terminal domain-containing protein [Nakamurella alba]MTD17195.1 alpha-mannosidase [Nakamurella alba]